MKEYLKKLFSVFLVFFRIGAFTFGGGYAMIPLISKETVENKKWISDEDILEIVAIAESTPGPIAINASTFIGYRVAGFFGAVCATLGVVMPSFLIIFLLSFVINEFKDNRIVKYAFEGIRAGVLALILKALFTMYSKNAKNLISYIIMASVFVLVVVFDVNILICILGCAAVGFISSFSAKRRNDK